ncbi:hypothetical protein [Bacteroides sp.]|uniref:hypothetical protein n=1 Tax=Bacteroides sp. TaxID=29523 RepID=UPI00261447C4|nr:hypothetical protein [Bacteroides sp.]
MVLVNQEVTPLVEGCVVSSMNKCESGEKVRYGLITLIELADKYYSGGIDITYVIKCNKLNLYVIMYVVDEMKKIGLIDCRDDNPNWFFLKEEPQSSWILEIVPKVISLFSSKEM